MKVRSQSLSIPKKRSRAGSGSAQVPQEWTRDAVLRELAGMGSASAIKQMEYFGVKVPTALGISAPNLKAMAKRIGKNAKLAEELWESGVHEARILAAFIGEADRVTSAQMERWAKDFNSWDVVDSCCCYLFAYNKLAWSKTESWSRRKEEYVKRAAFALMAYLSYKDKSAKDEKFIAFLRVIEREAHDERNFVRKAVNWALRNIGKRNLRCNREAIRAAEQIRKQGSRAARWIAADALRELKGAAVQARLRKKTA